MRKKILLAVIAVTIQLCLCSCINNTMSSGFKPDPPSNKKALVSSIQICKTVEARPLKGRSQIGRGFLTLIPLVPFANQQFTPDRRMMLSKISHSFLEDVSRTVRKDIQASGITRHTSILSTEKPAFPLPSNYYALCLRLHEGIWSRNVTSYGLSFAALALWLAGAPASYGDVILELEATIYSAEGKCLGTKRWHESIKFIECLFLPHQRLNRHLVTLYKRISPRLRQFVSSSIKKALLEKKNNMSSQKNNIHISNTKDRWLSLDEISRHLGVNENTILEYINKRKMPAYRIGNQWKFKKNKVDAWIEAGGSNVNNKR